MALNQPFDSQTSKSLHSWLFLKFIEMYNGINMPVIPQFKFMHLEKNDF